MTEKAKTLTREAYLSNDMVERFCDYLKRSIHEFPYGHHRYKSRKTNKEISNKEFVCTSLEEAASCYRWNNKDLHKTLGKMSGYRNTILSRDSGRIFDNEKILLGTCLELMDWGGVTGFSHDIAQRYSRNNLLATIESARKLLESPFDEGVSQSWGSGASQAPMNSGYTKIYAICFHDHVIYDSRVALGLAGLVRAWGRGCSDVNKQKSAKKLLGFRIPKPQGNSSSRKPPDDPGSCPVKFPWTYGNTNEKSRQQATWNIRANWIIGDVLQNYSVLVKEDGRVKFTYKEGLDTGLSHTELRETQWIRSRVMEMALFMIGYDVASAIS